MTLLEPRITALIQNFRIKHEPHGDTTYLTMFIQVRLLTKMRIITLLCHPSETKILHVGPVGKMQFSRLICSLTVEDVMLGIVQVCCKKTVLMAMSGGTLSKSCARGLHSRLRDPPAGIAAMLGLLLLRLLSSLAVP